MSNTRGLIIEHMLFSFRASNKSGSAAIPIAFDASAILENMRAIGIPVKSIGALGTKTLHPGRVCVIQTSTFITFTLLEFHSINQTVFSFTFVFSYNYNHKIAHCVAIEQRTILTLQPLVDRTEIYCADIFTQEAI